MNFEEGMMEVREGEGCRAEDHGGECGNFTHSVLITLLDGRKFWPEDLPSGKYLVVLAPMPQPDKQKSGRDPDYLDPETEFCQGQIKVASPGNAITL